MKYNLILNSVRSLNKKYLQLGIRFKHAIRISCLLVILAIIIGEGQIGFSLLKKNIISLYTDVYDEVILNSSESVSSLINQFNFCLDYLVANPADTNKDVIINKLDVVSKNLSSQVENIFFVEKNGIGFSSAGEYVSVSDREYFLKINEEKLKYYIGPSVVSKDSGAYVIPICKAFYNAQEDLLGFFIITVPVSSIFDTTINSKIINKNHILIIDTDGNFLMQPECSLVENLNSKPVFLDNNLNSVVERMKLQKSGHVSFQCNDGNIYLAVYTPIKNTPWSMGITVAEKDFFILFDSTFSRLIWILLICAAIFMLVIVSIIGVLLYRQIYKIKNSNEGLIDELTGLFTLKKFEREMESILEDDKENNYLVISFDIQGLKFINQTYGEKVGNDLLRFFGDHLNVFANRLNGICARGYADHFYALIPYKEKNEVLNLFHHEFYYKGNTDKQKYIVPVLKKSGLYFIEGQERLKNIRDYIAMATYARRSVKNTYQNEFAIFDEQMNLKLEEEKRLEACLHDAFHDNEFYVVFQPKISISTGKIVGAEALARLNSKSIGEIMPDTFIPVLERNGTIVKLDFTIYKKVFDYLQYRLDHGLFVVPISVNMSRQHLKMHGFVKEFSELYSKYSIPPELIEIEILEQSVSGCVEKIKPIIDELHTYGFKVAMDDFGSGESSLNMLDNIPVDILKIDRNFLCSTNDWEKTQHIILKIVELAKDLKKTVICEGVENPKQIDFLNSIDCDVVQGFFYSKPLINSEFDNFLLENQ